MAYVITDLNDFEIQISDGFKDIVIWKQNIRFGVIDGDTLPLYWHNKAVLNSRYELLIDWNDVTTPVVASAAALQTALEGMITSGWGGGAGDGGNVIAVNGVTAASTGTVIFSNANSVTFGMVGQTVTASFSHNGLTTQTPVALSGSNGSFAFSTATFGSSNGLHFYTTNGSMVGSYTVPTVTNSSWTVSDSATSGTVGRLAFTNLNGVTLSLSTGAGGSHTIVGSHNGLTSQSNQALSGSNGSFTFQTASFGSSNGMHFYTTNGSIVGSYTVPAGGVTPAISGSNGSFSFSTVTFGNLNGLSFYSSNGSMVGSYTVPPAGGGVAVSKFPLWLNYGSAQNPIYSGSSGNTGASTQQTLSYNVASYPIPHDVNFSQLIAGVANVSTTNGTGSATVGNAVGLYSLNANTALSLISSWQWQMYVSQNSLTARSHHWFFGTASSTNSSALNGNVSASFTVNTGGYQRVLMHNANATIPAGNYYLVSLHSYITSGVNAFSCQIVNELNISTALSKFLGEANITKQVGLNGWFSSTTNISTIGLAQLPSSIDTTAITMSSNALPGGWKHPFLIFERSAS